MQRPTGFITRLEVVVAATAAIALGAALSGCDTSPENANQVSEGQGMKLGDLLYNVQITRILNPGDKEDSAYLVGQKAPDPDQYYLAVFMRIDNEGSGSADVANDFNIVDTVGDTFDPIPSQSLFALKLGATVHPGDQLPEPETTAANGPIQGSMVLFRITGAAIQDRPLTLEIHSPDGSTGEVELDI
jgi:hypothetical protein